MTLLAKITDLKMKAKVETEKWYKRSDMLKEAKHAFLKSFEGMDGINFGMGEQDRAFVAYLDAEICRADNNAEFAHGQQIAYIIASDEIKKVEAE